MYVKDDIESLTDVMPEQQAVDLDEPGGAERTGTDDLDAVDEQLIARLAGRARAVDCS